MNTPLIQGQEIHGTPTLVRNKTVSFLNGRVERQYFSHSRVAGQGSVRKLGLWELVSSNMAQKSDFLLWPLRDRQTLSEILTPHHRWCGFDPKHMEMRYRMKPDKSSESHQDWPQPLRHKLHIYQDPLSQEFLKNLTSPIREWTNPFYSHVSSKYPKFDADYLLFHPKMRQPNGQSLASGQDWRSTPHSAAFWVQHLLQTCFVGMQRRAIKWYSGQIPAIVTFRSIQSQTFKRFDTVEKFPQRGLCRSHFKTFLSLPV